jgi:hypothetical protein
MGAKINEYKIFVRKIKTGLSRPNHSLEDNIIIGTYGKGW